MRKAVTNLNMESETETEVENEEKKEEKPKTLYFRKEYGGAMTDGCRKGIVFQV